MCRPLILLVTLLVTTQVHARPQDLLSLYQHLHANPELSFQEVNTSALVARELEAAGFEVTGGVGGEGVRESLKQGGAGPSRRRRRRSPGKDRDHSRIRRI